MTWNRAPFITTCSAATLLAGLSIAAYPASHSLSDSLPLRGSHSLSESLPPSATLTPTPPAGAPGNWKPTLGSILTIGTSSSTLGYNFQCGTTVSWTGVYNPPIGPDSTVFTIDWDETEVTLDSNWQLRVLLGGGTVTNMPTAIESLLPGGTLDGTLTVSTPCPGDMNCDSFLDIGDISEFVDLFLAGDPRADFNGDGFLDSGDTSGYVDVFLMGCASPVVITGATSMSIAMDAGKFQLVHYEGGHNSGLPSQVIGEVDLIDIISGVFNENEEPLRSMYGSHFAATVELESNVLSDALPPAVLVADVITIDASRVLVDSVEGIVLTWVSGGSGEPHLYSSDLAVPLMVFANQLSYTPISLMPIMAVDNGTFIVIAH